MKPLVLLPLLFCLNAQAQPSYQPTRMTPAQQARYDSARAQYFPPGTPAGISAEEMKEYAAIIARYRSRPDIPYSDWARAISPATQDQLRGLFMRMSRQQQLTQQIVFVRVEPPRPRKTLTEPELVAFRDSTHFNIILDGRAAANAVLEGWKATDFATYEVQNNMLRRAGSAYFTQKVTLQSNAYYEATQKRYEQNKDKYIMVNSVMRGQPVQRPAN